MMTSKRPYLLRAINEWILDNGLTPHILVDADSDEVVVPRDYIKDGRIVLNISPAAVMDLEINNELLLFNARFGGRPFQLRIPVRRVLAVYAKENGVGIIFPDDDSESADLKGNTLEKAPHLKLVK